VPGIRALDVTLAVAPPARGATEYVPSRTLVEVSALVGERYTWVSKEVLVGRLPRFWIVAVILGLFGFALL
jgi:hypothetical protein